MSGIEKAFQTEKKVKSLLNNNDYCFVGPAVDSLHLLDEYIESVLKFADSLGKISNIHKALKHKPSILSALEEYHPKTHLQVYIVHNPAQVLDTLEIKTVGEYLAAKFHI